jgi:hypothetical protein
MYYRLLLWLLFLSLVSSMSSVQATAELNIYSATVPVNSQSELVRTPALQQACRQVFIKVTGDKTILANSLIKDACLQCQLVTEFSYTHVSRPGKPFLLQVEFDHQAVNNLLSQAQQVLWQEDRPPLLALFTIGSATMPARLITQNDQPIANLLTTTAEELGLIIMLPSAADANLAPDIVTDIFATQLGSLTSYYNNYHALGLLLGKIDADNTRLNSQWRLLLGENQWHWDINRQSVPILINDLMDHVTHALRGLSKPINGSEASIITMIVNGINQQTELRQLLTIIHAAALVSDFNVVNITGNQVTLKLFLQGSKQIFQQSLQLQAALHLQGETDETLVYLWGS